MKRVVPFALLLAACGTEPRYASVTVSAAAPTATLSGHTSAAGMPAVELSPGCPGWVDPSVPEHVIHLEDATSIVVSARSLQGPVAIAVVGGGEVRCDADGGTGHAPHVTLSTPGEYAVHVGALASAMDFAYELEIAPATTGATTTSASTTERIGVTVTSTPAGATVRTPEGEVLGTTPAMFVLPVSADEMGRERHFIVELAGHAPADVSGRLVGGTMVLHANLTPAMVPVNAGPPDAGVGPAVAGGPVSGAFVDASVTVERPIRDYRTTSAAFDVSGVCTLQSIDVGLDVEHSFVGDLRISVLSPSGTEIVLRDHSGTGNAHLVSSYDPTTLPALAPLLGRSAVGRWEVRVRDDAGADTGTFHSASLRLGCAERTGASATAGPGTGGSHTGSGGRRTGGTYGRGPGGTGAGGIVGGGSGAGVIDPWSGRGPTTGGAGTGGAGTGGTGTGGTGTGTGGTGGRRTNGGGRTVITPMP
jgi:subtilisin-like proprotein convertase family protein